MINIWVNQQRVEIEKGFTILQLLEHLKSPKVGIAIAIQNAIISKNLWESITLSNDDTVLIIQATQGG
ncbi:sulfur carrier protein ThiS [Maribacter sp. ACAM166]|uniref:sulfur carrier protein ThiS n=1 Tax=Maribacter sp. ACAM166 TaxID=2508996 RepID=UPI0010FE943F|nr:sulfur carrier protein ThiS [Maribacter sp. ACAM166]TLP77266.1 sulfur carrier protein ThiS [Maribacter sp. ACAM166]